MDSHAGYDAAATGLPGALGAVTAEDVADIASHNAFANGERYQRQGRVTSLSIEHGGGFLRATVRGSAPRPYTVQVELGRDRRGDPEIEGYCTCPVGYNCKHVIAALLEAIRGSAAEAARTQPAGPIPVSLAPDLAEWVEGLVRMRSTETDEYPPDIRQRLIYVLAPAEPAEGQLRISVQPTSVRLRKDGSFADRSSAYDLGNALGRNPAKFLRPADREIARHLGRMPNYVYSGRGRTLIGEAGVEALAAMLATGRARWGSVHGPVLTQGPERRGRIGWRLDDGAAHRIELAIEPGADVRIANLAPPWYVEEATGVAGPIETGYPPRVAESILAAPPVPVRHGAMVRAAIERRLPELVGLVPPDAPPTDRIEGKPVPGLRLLARALPEHNSGYGYYGFGWKPPAFAPGGRMAVVRPFFRYGAVDIAVHEAREAPAFARDGRIVEVIRHRGAERAALTQLAGFGFAQVPYWYQDGSEAARGELTFADDAGEDGWIDFLYRGVPALRDAGWIVEIASDFPTRLVRGDGAFAAELREGSGIDWFELALGIMIDGERVDLLPAVLRLVADPRFDPALSADDARPLHLRLDDGRILAMPTARLRPILAALYELFRAGVADRADGRVAFSLLDAADLAGLEAATADAGIVWRGGERLREMGRLLRETGGIPSAAVPASFTARLRPYQARGVDWLQFLRTAGLGGVLADDMGLGKTVQALAWLEIERAEGRLDRPTLVVAPTSVLGNWRREAERLAPELKVLVLHGPERKACFAEIAAHDLVLTTYPLLARDHEALRTQKWHAVILDEAQTIKNPNATTTRIAGTLEARHRLCLTGTPLENHLGELWSLFAFLSPGFLGDRQSFNRRWRTPIEKQGDQERRLLLARRVRPFLLRRTKAEVAAELPSKTEIVETVEMEKAQRDVYEAIRLAMHDKVRRAIAAKGIARSHIVVLDALLKLRQACCDPRLLKLETAKAHRAGSAKLDRLMELLPYLVEEGRRVLLFSQFTSMLALIESRLAEAGLPYVLLTGSTRDRETPIRQFQAGEVPLFLISLKAGGLGLNLTAADTVVHYDPWWNPAVEDQATDRAHRIGQTRPVFVHKLMVADSIEEKMEALKARKRDLAAGIFDPDAGSPIDLTESDIEQLFAPG